MVPSIDLSNGVFHQKWWCFHKHGILRRAVKQQTIFHVVCLEFYVPLDYLTTLLLVRLEFYVPLEYLSTLLQYCFVCLFGVFRPGRVFINITLILFCLFEFYVPLETLSCKWKRASDFDRCSACMANEQLGFLSVPNVLCHGTCVWHDHLRKPVTLTPVADCLAVELTLPVAAETNALTDCTTAAAILLYKYIDWTFIFWLTSESYVKLSNQSSYTHCFDF